MYALMSAHGATEAERLSDLLAQARALLEGSRDAVANAANLSSLIYHSLPELNWAGFYWMKGGELVLGPFQGKPACVRIALGKGVCGTAALERRTILVPDVDKFPGHIACDSASRSEIVVPILRHPRPRQERSGTGSGVNPSVLGVLDIDSPVPSRFDPGHARALEELVAVFVDATDLGTPGERG